MPGSAIFEDNLIDSIYADVVDGVRSDLLPEMGIRPYTVELAIRNWESGQIGEGDFVETLTKLDPIPRVHSWNDSIVKKLEPCGLLEEGDVVISEVSLSYTHAEIGADEPLDGQQIMLRISEGHGQASPARYFVHKYAPFIDREQTMGWIMQLRLVR